MKSSRLMLVAVVITLYISGCLQPATAAEPWNKTDIALEGAFLAAHAIDWAQTLKIAHNPDKWHEHNPILGKHPKAGHVNLVMGIMAVVQPVIAHLLPSPYRRIWIGSCLIPKLICVGNNFSIGLGWGVKW